MTNNALPSVTVLLAAFNGMDYIGEQLESILAQQGVQVRVYVSVDLSQDGTHAWCLDLARRESRVSVLPYGERFGGAARNFFRLLRDVNPGEGDFVAYADQDDIWEKDKLINAITRMRTSGSSGYSSNVTAFWPDGRTRLVQKAQPQQEWDYLFEAAGPGCTYVMAAPLAAAIKATVIADWPLVNQLGLHDWFSYAFARANGHAWYIDAWPSMMYRQHEGNEVGANHGMRAFRYRLSKVIAGWGIEQSALTARLAGQAGHAFVRSWSGFKRTGFLKLAFSAARCRRRPRDQIFFFFACCLLAVVGKR